MVKAIGAGQRYWFPRKRIGLGWGLPATWQGWPVFVVYILVLIGSAVFTIGVFDVICVPLTLAFVVIVVLTGDPEGRHWNRS